VTLKVAKPVTAAAVDHTIGTHVRRLRTARGITQRELAEPKFSRTLLAAVEAGARTPSDDMLEHLARRLEVDVDDLRHGRPAGIADELTRALVVARQRLSHGEVDEAVAVLAGIEADARRYGLTDLVCWAGFLLGEAEVQRGDLHVAMAAFDRLAGVLAIAGPAPRAAVLARRAYCQFASGDAEGAVAALEDELRSVRQAPRPNPDAQLRLLAALMYAFIELEWLDRARRLAEEADALLAEVSIPEWRAHYYTTAGQLRRTEAELDEARRLFVEAERLYRGLNLRREIGYCRWGHGYVLRRVGRLAEAAEEFDVACDLLREAGASQDYAGAALELAEVRRRQGDLVEAVRLADEVTGICEQSGHVECMAEADRLLGLVARERGEHPEAERLLRGAAQRYEAVGLMAESVTTFRLLGELLLEVGRRRDAAAVFRRGLRAAERLR
jgi:tetratricopeptide (TPR) repeat protein